MPNFSNYLKKIETALRQKNATEHTHRPALKDFLESFAKGITATNEPKRVKCGAPDYIITKSVIPLGYVEAKDIGEDLDKVEKSDQLKRYRESLNNLILTDYLEFRWFVRGEKRLTVRLADVDKNGNLTPTESGEKDFTELINLFLTTQIETVGTPKELASRMASIARLIRVTIEKALTDERETEDEDDFLREQMKSFREVLLPDLTEHQFADLYAQTIAYGLFSARCNHKGSGFTRQSAGFDLPKTNPFLRQLFGNIAGINLDERIVWAVDDLAELLNRSDIAAILADFGKRTRQEDPVVHFYETFLAAYDPKMRESRGVYYTPEPVVSYIVRSVDRILREDFGLAKGLGDSSKIKVKSADGKTESETHKLLILDPATGTGTFLYSVIKQIYKQYERKKGMWNGYVSEHLLPRIFGFELLVAPYAVAHLKLGLLLDETGYDFQKNERLRVFLTNTLEEVDRLASVGGLSRWLNEEADFASHIKQNAPVMVVLGNPPYSGHSANKGRWIEQLLHGTDSHTGKRTGNYFEVDGKPLGERQPKWLNDDYVKFIRFSQYRIEQTGYGILAFVTNHGYLDNPTFRGMRQSLMETFDEIYLLDLHGNSKKKEKSPDGTKDENVFDIQQGVSIGIFIKKQDSATENTENTEKKCRVFHRHLYGVRETFAENVNGEKELVGGKYQWLERNDIRTTEWKTLSPNAPFYLFIPQDETLREEYENSWKITDVMPLNSIGFQTHRDSLVIDVNKSDLQDRIARLRDLKISNEEISSSLGIGSSGTWSLEKARKLIAMNDKWKDAFAKCSYRPFDKRNIYYDDTVVERRLFNVLGNLLQPNIALATMRQTKADNWQHAFVTDSPAPAVFVEIKDGASIFPLYLYPTAKQSLFDFEDESRRPNLAPEFLAEFAAKLQLQFLTDGKGDLQKTFAPEDIFNYAYAVFHSPTYRARYAEFLKIDFPRLPLTSNLQLFRELSAHGEKLVGLHLLEKDAPEIAGFPESGENIVEFVKFNDGKVSINKTQYFEGIPETVWNFHIGGYRVAEKWLKDRKGRKLTFDDLEHYQKTVAALAETIEIMQTIDETIEENGGFPLV